MIRPNVVNAACRVTATFLTSRVNYDPYTLNRLTELLSATMGAETLDKLSKLYSWRARLLVNVAVSALYFGRVFSSSNGAPSKRSWTPLRNFILIKGPMRLELPAH